MTLTASIIATLTGIVLLIGGMLVQSSLVSNGQLGGVVANAPTHSSANITTGTAVGPDTDITVASANSRRSYLHLQNDGETTIYCEAASSADANQGIALTSATTSRSSYEFTSNKGNLFVGDVVCMSSASTTVLVTEFVN